MANAFADLPSGYWEDGSTLVGADLRRGNLFATTGGSAGLTARGGVRQSRGNPLGVSLPGGMFVRIQPGTAAIPTTNEGAYILSVVTATDLIVTAAHATQARIDTVGLEVVPGTTDTWRVRMLDGTPSAGTPVAPTYAVAGGVFLPIADVRVNAAVSVPTSVTDRRVYTAAAGGVVPMPGVMDLSKASRDALTDLLPVGTPVWDDTNSTFGVVDGTRRLTPIGPSEPVMVQSSAQSASGTPLQNTLPLVRFSPTIFSATLARSGWAYIQAELDLDTVVGNWQAAYAQVQVDSVPLPGSDRTLWYWYSGLGRTSVTINCQLPVWFDGGVARELCLAVAAFAGGAGNQWRINTIRWSVLQP